MNSWFKHSPKMLINLLRAIDRKKGVYKLCLASLIFVNGVSGVSISLSLRNV
jgi:hypothetical protein